MKQYASCGHLYQDDINRCHLFFQRNPNTYCIPPSGHLRDLPQDPRRPGSKRPRALSRLPEKDSTKLSGLDVNVDLIGEMMEQDGTTGGDEKGDGKKVFILVWFRGDNLKLIATDNAIGRQGHLDSLKSHTFDDGVPSITYLLDDKPNVICMASPRLNRSMGNPFPTREQWNRLLAAFPYQYI
jgi:hypothetical protein